MNKIDIKMPINHAKLLTFQNKFFHLIFFKNADAKE